MKKIVLLFISIVFSIILTAQNPLNGKKYKLGKPDFKLEFSDTLFSSGTPQLKFADSDDSAIVLLKSENLKNLMQKPTYKMPVAKLKPQSKMPVFVPDANVVFYLKNKQVDFYNPLEQHFIIPNQKKKKK